MSPQILLLVMKHNGDNVKNIIETIGIENLLKLMPDIMAIVETLQSASSDAAKPS
jgi:hypothetical protein